MIKVLIEGLILSGLAISMIGNSRPASGAEHHISHFLETKILNNTNIPHYFHGETVALGTYIMMNMYDMFVAMVAERRGFSQEEARKLADGRIFTGMQAKAAGLIDKLGGENEARAWLLKMRAIDITHDVFFAFLHQVIKSYILFS